ncbi:hypothetical protein K503DRAFT_344550 [Rhizopogon vinicolor AM-OR11-026]|uniref:Chitin-binding type-2 domain-containing protein n=1 Tax=Rhizopogon vinicolor AM-OR11-026 TaxID=1314800 RepID=A0A1B7MT60_9AGAM|nr:hypothetical protein K503DRAFT_344550 [Rhizopogon vinicolor AM-OR11-026]
MKFTSLNMIVSAVAMAGIATAAVVAIANDPNGGPCAKPGNYECGHRAGYNHGNSFMFYCTASATVDVLQLCSCLQCCSVTYTNGGYYVCT